VPVSMALPPKGEAVNNRGAEAGSAKVARRAGVLPAVAHREVSPLVDADVLRDRREGNNRLVRVNMEHPLWRLMSQIVVETYGSAPLLRNLLADCPASAKPTSTGPGLPPRDIDLLAVGNPSRTGLLDVADAAQRRLPTEVSIHTTTPEAWVVKDRPFLVTVASGPLVTLVGPGTAGD
jgi:hypothetical protein